MIHINIFCSLGRHSRYIRWRRSNDEEPEESLKSADSESLTTASSKSIHPTSAPVFEPPTQVPSIGHDTADRVQRLKGKLLQLLSHFIKLFDLFQDNQMVTAEYLDSTDEAIHL